MKQFFRPYVAVCAFIPLALRAQGPPGADTISQRAAGESLAVLRTLDAAVRGKPAADVVFHRGMVAWVLAARARAKPPLTGIDAKQMERTAESSLHDAVNLDPDNARYRLAVAQYTLAYGSALSRAGTAGQFERALELARAGGDADLRTEAAIEAARVYWRRYESEGNRRLETDSGLARSIEEAVTKNPLAAMGTPDEAVRLGTDGGLASLHNALIEYTQALPADFGLQDYQKAEALFREAYTTTPTDARAFRQLAMLLAEKQRWSEITTLSRERVKRLPRDGWGWFTLGMALHRVGESAAATAVFDTAVTRLDERDRARLVLLTRIVRPADSTAYVRSTPAARNATEQTFWLLADPLWSRAGNDARTEFLARVAYAELRWTVEEMGVHGADSDRGDIYIRFGPPAVIAKLPPRNSRMDMTVQSAESLRVTDDGGANLSEVTFWDYPSGLVVVFWGMPGYATARFASNDRQHIDYLIDKTPARFDNVARERLERIPVQVARFRAGPDSVDVWIAADPPVAAIRAAASANSPVRADFWLYGREVPNAYRDSLALGSSSVTMWSYRVPPASYLYRVEATAPDAMVAGAVSAWVNARADSATGFSTRGFGISDLLLARQIEAPAAARRWNAITVTPLLGALPRNAQMGIVWENYEFGSRDGSAQYDVIITIQRQRSAAGRIAAEVIGAIAGAVGVDRRSDRVTMRYERTVPYGAALVDYVEMTLGETPPGTYRLTLEVADKVTGRTSSRSTDITIRN